jgi:DNA recombination protein RmuC
MGPVELTIVVAVAFLFLILIGVVIWLATKLSNRGGASDQAIANLSGKLDAIQKQVDGSLQSVTTQVAAFGEVKETLGQVTAATNRVAELGKDITSLQNILQAGVKRGAFGEILLENLLAQILPPKFYKMQYYFNDREHVDAAIFLGDRLLPIDSKFPLEGFEADGASKAAFARSVRGRIDETAKYIRPAEHTLAFAMLYVPAENIYYDIINNPDLFQYAMGRHVIPVSPNSMFAYLQVVVFGLRGLEIEDHARMILEQLSSVKLALGQVQEQYEKLGTHIAHTQSAHADLGKKVEKVTGQLAGLASVTLPSPAASSPPREEHQDLRRDGRRGPDARSAEGGEGKKLVESADEGTTADQT